MISTKLLLLVVLAFITTALGEDLTCYDEYSQKGKWCYKLINAVTTFGEADKLCKSKGGNVASISSKEENAYIASFNEEVFIGLVYNISAKDFTWTDGTLFDFSMWDENYPMSPQFYGNCVKMLKSGKWMNSECNWKAEYVCKKAATHLQCPVKPNNQFLVKGEITSPGYPENYIAGLSCTYELLVTNDRNVIIELFEMVLGDGDTIEIFSRLVDDSAYRIAVLSGNFTSESEKYYGNPEEENKMLVKFTSNSQQGGYWKFAFRGGCQYEWLDDPEGGIDYCYKRMYYPSSFSDAKMLCEREGAQLISIHNAFENKFVKERIIRDGNFYWLGLFYENGSWKWTDGSSGLYTNWSSGQPRLSSGACVLMMPGGTWQSYECDSIGAYPACYKQ